MRPIARAWRAPAPTRAIALLAWLTSVASVASFGSLACDLPATFQHGGGTDAGPPADSGDAAPLDAGAGADASADSGACTDWALSFDGSNQWAWIIGAAAFDALGAFTVEAWVQTGPSLVPPSEGHIASHHDDALGAGWVLMVIDGFVEFRVYGAGPGASVRGPTPITPGTWHHLAGTFDASATSVWVDGVLDWSEAPVSSSTLPFGGPMVIGNAAVVAMPFQGVIDEVRVSSAVLYTTDFPRPSAPFGTDAATIALWHLNEGTGQTAYDTTSNNWDMVLGLDGSTGASDPAWIAVPCIPDR